MLNASLMVYLYSFLFGYFFTEFKKIKNKYFSYILIISIIFLTALYLSIDVITNQGLTRSFWFHINNNFIDGSYTPFVFILLYEIIKIVILFAFGLILRKKFFSQIFFLDKKLVSFILIFFFLIFNPSILSSVKNSTNFFNKSNLKNIIFKNQFYELKSLSKNFKNRDIIFITAESLERSFYSNKKLQALNLKLLNRNDAIDFKNIEEIYGFTDWTIAGLVAANCGLPILKNGFYDSYNCLSDLLFKQNYTQKLIQGSSPEFAGNGNFYKIHNLNEIIGPKKISEETSKKNLSYSYWGLHDHIVLDFAKKEIEKLENDKKNYSIWINTLDNHAPNGFLSNYCKKLTTGIKQQILKTTYCTDLFINKFINEVFESDLDKNNIIIIHSDHLIMGSPVNKKFFKTKSERSNLFLIIDPYNIKKKKIINSKGNILDLPATILDYLGENKNFGLGRSLLDETQNTSLSSFNLYTDQILKKFENNLDLINKKIDISNASIVLEKKVAIFKNGLEAKLPVFFIDNQIIQSKTDINGNPRDVFDEKLKDLIEKNKEFNFESIASCNEVKNIVSEFNTMCKYTYVKFIDNENIVELIFSPIIQKNNKYLISDQKNIIIKIKKNTFVERIEKLNKNKSFLSVAYNNFRSHMGKNLKSDYPKVYPYIQKVYINVKYFYLRLYFKFFLKSETQKNYLIKNDTFIAHAGGSINSDIYTNSLEALDKNYNLGSRYLELDLKLTSDNIIVAVHDWVSWKNRTNYEGEVPPTYHEFMKYKIDGKYSPLSEYEIIKWFTKYNDAYLITDKLDDFKKIQNTFINLKNRLIVELFTEKSIEEALLIHDSKILISQRILWQKKFSEKYLDILALGKNSPYGFAVHNNKVYENPDFFKKAKSLGFKTYVYGMDDNKLFNSEKNVLCDLSVYIDGIYSDINLKNNNLMVSYCK